MIDYGRNSTSLLRIGVFIDGGLFSHVSAYYAYEHKRKARINISGLYRFILAEIAQKERVDAARTRIVDSHYFRGRLSAEEADRRNILFHERKFDEILRKEGVTTHYLPVVGGGEKGIDVWLALEAFELAIHKRFDVVALIATDGDYIQLVRKLNTIGTRVAIFGWDFKFIDQQGRERETKTSRMLINEANYPFLMNREIDDPSRQKDPLIKDLFLQQRDSAKKSKRERAAEKGGKLRGVIKNLLGGYGYIKQEKGPDLFFHYNGLGDDLDFSELKIGDCVTFEMGKNDKGPIADDVQLCD
jgi:cold shock CspA family protein/uncharacterized LabA/DUF88 family protein